MVARRTQMAARGLAVGAALLFVSACAGSAERQPLPGAAEPATASQRHAMPANVRVVCPHTATPGVAFCEALARTDVRGDAPSGYGPTDLQSAYSLPSLTNGAGQTIAIVDAYDDPNAEADLFTYRNTFGLPVCSTLNGCFAKVNQRGSQRSYPKPNADWSIEISLDLDVVSAACPNCNILLVESDTNSWRHLGLAVDEAVTLGAHIVNNSYGAIGNGAKPSDYDHTGVVMLASSGDSGYNGHHDQEPADLPTVVAVGGTTLTKGGTGRGWSETVWGGAGSGCSKLPKPTWQTDTGCKFRTATDVSSEADPQTGVAVYDSYQQSGWMVIGGTSASSPLNAAAFALAGNASQMNAAQGFYNAQSRQYLNDITSGSNGTCKPAYLCTGEVGYDGPTGWGTPNGVGAY